MMFTTTSSKSYSRGQSAHHSGCRYWFFTARGAHWAEEITGALSDRHYA